MFGLFDTVLDPDTAERLLAGRLLLDDAPPDARAVTQVINRLAVAPTAAELEHETAAVSAIAAAVRQSAPTRPPATAPMGRLRIMPMVAACVLGATTLFGGLAAANALPRPAQRVAAGVFGSFGVSIPTGTTDSDGTPAPSGGSSSTSSGKGSTVDHGSQHKSAPTTSSAPAPSATKPSSGAAGGASSGTPTPQDGSNGNPANGDPAPSNPSNGGVPPGQDPSGSGNGSGNGNGNGTGDSPGSSGNAHDHAPGQLKKQS
jgi:hypothetical protein